MNSSQLSVFAVLGLAVAAYCFWRAYDASPARMEAKRKAQVKVIEDRDSGRWVRTYVSQKYLDMAEETRLKRLVDPNWTREDF